MELPLEFRKSFRKKRFGHFTGILKQGFSCYSGIFAWERIWVMDGTMSSFVARVTAGVDPGIQKMADP